MTLFFIQIIDQYISIFKYLKLVKLNMSLSTIMAQEIKASNSEYVCIAALKQQIYTKLHPILKG